MRARATAAAAKKIISELLLQPFSISMVKKKNNTGMLQKMKSNPDAFLKANRKYTNSMKHVTFATPIHTVFQYSHTQSAKQNSKKCRQQRLNEMRLKEMMHFKRIIQQEKGVEQNKREQENLKEKQILEEEAKTIQDRQDHSYLDLSVAEAQKERQKLEEEDRKKRELEDTESDEWSEVSSTSTSTSSEAVESPLPEEIDFGATLAEDGDSDDDFGIEEGE